MQWIDHVEMYTSKRPPVEKRLFRSEVVERVIEETVTLLKNEKLRKLLTEHLRLLRKEFLRKKLKLLRSS